MSAIAESRTVPIATLRLWERNPRCIKGDRFNELKERLKRQGQIKPLLVAKDGKTVIGGNMRLRAMQELGITDVWVSQTTAATDKDIFDLALTDNEEFGYYEEQQLAELALELQLTPIELRSYALSLGNTTTLDLVIDKFGPDEVEEDEPPEVDDTNPPVSRSGEIYGLGRHRLMCGSATDSDAVAELMDGAKADMVFTDPPYGVNFTGAKYNPRAKHWEGIENDDKQGASLSDFITSVFDNVTVSCREATPCYVWSAPMLEGYSILTGLTDASVHVQSQLIWYKNTIVLGQADYQWKHEVCWYGWTPGQHHYWEGGRSLSTVWEYKKDANQSYVHPTQKPTQLAANAITNSCKVDGIVLDVFGGSGSTLMAAEQKDRSCYMMELDPKYCDVIRKRYANHIGESERWAEETSVVNEVGYASR